MQPIRFTQQCFWAGENPLYLVSGEFHYFRVPKPDWQRRMRLFKEAGGNCLATYIPWLLHEPREGQFRFEGEDWLDLEGFLRTANEEGLYVIARPGPYQYSELVYHGLPGWLVEDYPTVLAQKPNGEPIGYASVSYTHPLFLEKVRGWFDAVLPILARWTITQGGPIAFVQIDNELVGIHEWFGSLDYHPDTMGIGRAGGAYPAFLAQRYGSISALNAAYDSDYASFDAVLPVPGKVDTPGGAQFANHAAAESEGSERLTGRYLASIRRRKDYFDFYLSTIADYAQTLVGMIRAHGIDSPIMHNSANPGMNAYFLETTARLGDDFLLGSDHYYNLSQTWAQNHPTPQYAAKCFLSLEMLRLMGYPPSVLEMPGGSASNWPPVLPNDALAAYQTNLALGMKGVNYYIFTGGPNPPGAGNTTDLYDYDAGISAHGEIRPLYEAQKTFGRFVQSHPSWLTARRLSDFRLGMDFEYQRSGQYWREPGPFLFGAPDAANFLRLGVLSSALCASLSPELVDLDQDDWTGDTSTPLVLACASSMGRAKQDRVVDFLKRGGRVLITPVLPAYDENLQPCTVLSDFLGSPRQTANPRGLARPRIGKVVNVNGTTYPFNRVPDGAEIIGADEFSGEPLALSIATAGGGQAVLLGLHWHQAMREHERMLLGLLESLGLVQAIRCSNPNLWATAYEDGRDLTVFLINLFTGPMEARVQVQTTAGMVELGEIIVDPVSVRSIVKSLE